MKIVQSFSAAIVTLAVIMTANPLFVNASVVQNPPMPPAPTGPCLSITPGCPGYVPPAQDPVPETPATTTPDVPVDTPSTTDATSTATTTDTTATSTDATSTPTLPAVGDITIDQPTEGAELSGSDYNYFTANFVDANGSTTNDVNYQIAAGTCGTEVAAPSLEGQMETNDNNSYYQGIGLSDVADGDYCFTVTVASTTDVEETPVSDSVNFTKYTPSEVSIWSPYGTVNGLVNFSAHVTFGSPALTNSLTWAVYRGDCEINGTQVAGNTGDFEDSYAYEDGQFSATINSTSWAHDTYCFVVNPTEADELSDTVSSRSNFYVGFNRIYGQKYEDVDGDSRLNYEIDRLVPNYPIVATNNVTGVSVSTTTDDEGTYYFELPDGVWTISEGAERGWEEIRAYQGYVFIDEGVIEGDLPTTCDVYVGMSEARAYISKGGACTFLNKQVATRSSGGGTKVKSATTAPTGLVLGISTTTVASSTSTSTPAFCVGGYLTSYLRMGMENPYDQVVRLQVFLNAFGFKFPITGTFDAATDKAVREFQEKYMTSVLTPWAITTGTGYVFKTTRSTINNLVCPNSEVAPKI